MTVHQTELAAVHSSRLPLDWTQLEGCRPLTSPLAGEGGGEPDTGARGAERLEELGGRLHSARHGRPCACHLGPTGASLPILMVGASPGKNVLHRGALESPAGSFRPRTMEPGMVVDVAFGWRRRSKHNYLLR